MHITIIGDGGWGTAVGLLLNGYGHAVTLWGPFPEVVDEIRERRENTRFLPGIPLPETLRWTADAAEAVAGADVVILASPSKFLAQVCERFKGLIPADCLTVSLTKGLCETTHCRMSQLARTILGLRSIVVLSGPSHAEEVARRLPTAVVAASEEEELTRRVQQLFSGPAFRVYTSPDPLGVEIGGAVKNVIAIAVGVSDGLGFGDNSRAALITRGLAEITRFGTALGACPATFSGLSGAGDLIVTCTSRHSRNHMVGERLGRGERIQEILDSMKMVAEGVWNAKIIHALSRTHGVSMPITEVVHALCYEGLSARDAVEALMTREVKPEQ
ncbi:MAG TPA: NAD(P)H-dependent glycerol-3-phosphate dehydrogenase [Kiritimatiellia bacterium]|nr:NAD(P)H-dependent glycerol-3-phosphate dehydrogenase [Kiritimatiellia bacterium]HOR97152.1 NAD(P)H-dependent glycerol-3-phosphate dehydrogenase [Kiritimatiellia bacterium]HPC48657.1 NAD(P)H-dependent glycerol-3-phosphate dehydrogenase [Kiritimatiellia bacterium]HPK37925.1 NAD(P)H-dependent glycerol-3-phosphate dehydrogenase [Kiritimatiellia bacterium]HPW74693.1 NAD(P)H-dependent glycerol-3-phosphate dehydrogenase [Kiritimatiellia bacterium]